MYLVFSLIIIMRDNMQIESSERQISMTKYIKFNAEDVLTVAKR